MNLLRVVCVMVLWGRHEWLSSQYTRRDSYALAKQTNRSSSRQEEAGSYPSERFSVILRNLLKTGCTGDRGMHAEKEFENLIEAGWSVLRSDFTESAFLHWRKRVQEYLSASLGQDHPYAKCFEEWVQPNGQCELLVGVGLLTAAEMSTGCSSRVGVLEEMSSEAGAQTP